MKNIRLDLELFNESCEDCAAEQSLAGEDPIFPSKEKKDDRGVSEAGETAKDSSYMKIASLLGIEGDTEEGIISALNSRRLRAYLSQKLKERSARKEYSALISEADRLSLKNKGFDLKKELSDKRFGAMLRAGLSMEEAWRAIHTEDIINEAKEAARREAVLDAIDKLRMNTDRPLENGMAGKAPARSQMSVESLTGRGIRDILRRVENGAKIKF